MNPRFLLLAPFLLATTPDTAAGDAGNRAGREVVATVCSACHQAGLNGAPKIGDKEAWIPRMKRGLDVLSLSAIRGHGGMPARGGKAELTDPEIRSAIAYMFDPGAAARLKASPPARQLGANEALVDGIEVNFGLVSAERLRAYPRDSAEGQMHGGVPSGSGYYHVNVTLFDAASHGALGGASVEVEVRQSGTETQSKALEPVRRLNSSSYGQYVRLAPRVASTFTVHIRKAGSERDSVVRFAPTPD